MKSIAKEKQEFIRLEMTKAELLKMFEVSVGVVYSVEYSI